MKRVARKCLCMAVVGLVVAVGFPTPIPAGTIQTPMGVTANVNATCTFGSINSVVFGSYGNDSNSVDGTGGFTLQCTSGAIVTMGIDEGVNPAAGSSSTTPLRQMFRSGGTPGTANDLIRYDLYQDGNRVFIWGGLGTPNQGLVNGAGVPVFFTVYGRIPGGQGTTKASGTYSDIVLITVLF